MWISMSLMATRVRPMSLATPATRSENGWHRAAANTFAPKGTSRYNHHNAERWTMPPTPCIGTASYSFSDNSLNVLGSLCAVSATTIHGTTAPSSKSIGHGRGRPPRGSTGKVRQIPYCRYAVTAGLRIITRPLRQLPQIATARPWRESSMSPRITRD